MIGKRIGLAVLLLAFAACLLAGGRSALAAEKPQKVQLPAWAPKSPSPEFLKAAKTLKPLPAEIRDSSRLDVPCWELFGSLDDKQYKTFMTLKEVKIKTAVYPESSRDIMKKKFGAVENGEYLVYKQREVSIPFKSLTPRRRKIYDRLAAAWRQEFKGRANDDLPTMLYKTGAKQDLSNVSLVLSAPGGHEVMMGFMVKVDKTVVVGAKTTTVTQTSGLGIGAFAYL
jgi:hypothetical protein